MTDQTGRERTIKAAGDLAAALQGIGASIGRLDSYGKRNRHLIWSLGVSLVLDVLLTVVVAVFAVQAHDATTSATAAKATAAAVHQSNVSACQAGNDARTQQAKLWEFVESLIRPPAHANPQKLREDKAVIAALELHVRETFQPRNCTRIYRLRTAPPNPGGPATP